MTGPTPFLDFFKRGEVARDVRMLAAQGALAPRASEQLALLVLLLEDPDAEIRDTAADTLNQIPEPALKAFLARPDVPVGLREFFARRGILPEEMPAVDVEAEASLVNADEESGGDLDLAEEEHEDNQTAMQKIAGMGFTERLRAAMQGSREMRAILIRDPNKMISAAVLASPKLTGQEVEAFARMATVSEEVLRTIGNNRAWTKSYNVVVGLTKNPKTPLAMSMNFMARLNSRDLAQLSVDRNVPEPLRIAARKKVVANASGR